MCSRLGFAKVVQIKIPLFKNFDFASVGVGIENGGFDFAQPPDTLFDSGGVGC